MAIKLFTLHDDRYLPLAKVTVPAMRRFTQIHGYEFVLQKERLCEMPASWNKLVLLLAHLKPDDVGIWLDCDVVIRNDNFDLSPWFPKDGITFSQDGNGICAGAFITRGEWALDFLNSVLNLGDVGGCYKWEQDAIKVLQKYFPSVSSRFNGIPEEHLANPAARPHPANPFAVHLWADHWAMSNVVNAAKQIQTNWSWELQCQINNRETILPPAQTPSRSAVLTL